MGFNLMREAWWPVRYSDGTRKWIAPWQMLEETEHGVPVGFASGRADIDGALTEFSIGLVQTFLAPKDEYEWAKRWKKRPHTDELREVLLSERALSVFELLDGKNRFMQDEDPLSKAEPTQIEALLMDSAGEKTIGDGKDHFTKRDRIGSLCPRCATAVLFTLQTYAPSGGSGHRVSLRGGGPLTTVVSGTSIWETVWLNTSSSVDSWRTADTVFPWMGPTRTSDDDSITTPDDVHLLQCHWGMPRRIRLESSDVEGRCGLCGEDAKPLIPAFRTRNYGVSYGGGWQHPLSPIYLKDNIPLHVHPRPGGLKYGFWLGLIAPDRAGGYVPAKIILQAAERLQRGLIENSFAEGGLPVRAFGYDMDNMKARCWYEGLFPLHRIDPAIASQYEEKGRSLVIVADKAASCLQGCVSDAGGLAEVAARRFWRETEGAFYQSLGRIRKLLEARESTNSELLLWLRHVRTTALALFEEAVSIDELGECMRPAAVVAARKKLRKFLSEKNRAMMKHLEVSMDSGKEDESESENQTKA